MLIAGLVTALTVLEVDGEEASETRYLPVKDWRRVSRVSEKVVLEWYETCFERSPVEKDE